MPVERGKAARRSNLRRDGQALEDRFLSDARRQAVPDFVSAAFNVAITQHEGVDPVENDGLPLAIAGDKRSLSTPKRRALGMTFTPSLCSAALFWSRPKR